MHFSSGGSPMITVNDSYKRWVSAMAGPFMLVFAFCAVLFPSTRNAAAQERGPSQHATTAGHGPVILQTPSYDPVYRIPLRVHVGKSGRRPEDFMPILDEINDIWLSQAGICFEMQIVLDDKPLMQGMDIWFMPDLPGGTGLNGYFRDEHNIQVRDTPILGPAANPAHYPAARTAAHEFGHGLSLRHRQNSDDNLMRSKTFGWRLNGREVRAARGAAAEKALPDTEPGKCEKPRIVISPQPPAVSAMPTPSQLDRESLSR
jgi:hypothetical protein